MVEAIAAHHPDRIVHAVGDAAYVGDHLRGLDKQITWTSRLKVTSVLHELAPHRPSRPATHQRRPTGHPHRPRGHRNMAKGAGPPLRTHRHRRDHRDRVPVVWLVPQPDRASGPGPRQQTAYR
jgi:hypothetical protein